jgi:hypothetical protein
LQSNKEYEMIYPTDKSAPEVMHSV